MHRTGLPAVALPWFLFALVLSWPAGARAELRDLPPFDVIVIAAAADLVVEVDPSAPQEVRVEAGARLLPRVVTEVRDGRLYVDLRRDWGPLRGGPDVYVRVPSLRALRIDGAVDADLRGLAGRGFELEASGAGKVRLAGRVDRLELEVGGACDVEAFDLRAEEARVRLSGVGGVEVCVADVLDAAVSGVGRVTYDCDPRRVRPRVDGVGHIGPR